jgi:hypothetical protein
MITSTLVGVVVVAAGGLLMGGGAWPFKLLRKYQFEHWWFIGNAVGLVVLPWSVTLLCCPNPGEALRAVPWSAILLGNIFALGWGIANVLCGLCFVRIGVALTGAILAGLGVSLGSIVPMVFKGSGQFQDAPDLVSAQVADAFLQGDYHNVLSAAVRSAGICVLFGVGVMLVGVVLASLAGFGHERALKKSQETKGNFLGGLVMTVIAGVLSSFMAFSFVYSQGPIVACFSQVQPNSEIELTVKGHEVLSGTHAVQSDGSIKVQGRGQVAIGGLRADVAADRVAHFLDAAPQDVSIATASIPATFAVFAIALMSGAAVNVGYTAYLITRNKSWGVLAGSGREFCLCIIIGVDFGLALFLGGKGMLLLGALGASVGWGIQQAMQMTGGQLLGFISGEWRGVHGTPRVQMYTAIAILLVASIILAYAKTLAG